MLIYTTNWIFWFENDLHYINQIKDEDSQFPSIQSLLYKINTTQNQLI